jgi:predicted small lipoprotein YifL
MQFRKFGVVLLVVALLMGTLAGCGAQGSMAQWPDRALDVNLDTALAAQDMAMGVIAGDVELSEEEFSSLLTYLLKQNMGENSPVDSIMTWFEPDNQIFIRVNLKDGVLLNGNSLDLAGSVGVEDQHVVVNIDEAGANGYSAGGMLTAPVSEMINNILAGPQFGVAAHVSTDTGMITFGLGDGM